MAGIKIYCKYCGKKFTRGGKRDKLCPECWDEVQNNPPMEKRKVIEEIKRRNGIK